MVVPEPSRAMAMLLLAGPATVDAEEAQDEVEGRGARAQASLGGKAKDQYRNPE